MGELRSKGIVIQEGRKNSGAKSAIQTTKKVESTKRKASTELYRSIDNLTRKGKKTKSPEGFGVYTLGNTNSAILNVSLPKWFTYFQHSLDIFFLLM